MYLLTVFNLFLVTFCFGANPKPWEPMGKTGSWLKRHESFLKTTRELKNVTKVVFIGASMTEFWQNQGKEIWHSYYLNRSAVNYGISGDTTCNVLWRIQNHELDGLNPKVIVLQIGYNNFHAYKPEPNEAEIGRGVIEVTKQLRAKCPGSKIINIGIFPLSNKRDDTKVKTINELLEKNADNKQVFFLDIGPQMVDKNGNHRPGVFRDGLHLTAAGYEIWHQTMKPLFEKLYQL